MIDLIVYADVLIFLNLIVDYFLLLATSKIVNRKVRTVRMVLSALAGGISSLYIFLPPQKTILEFAFKVLLSAFLTLLCFGFESIKQFLRTSGIFFGVTCTYAGLMFAFWFVFKPYGMVVNNSVVYFNISPTVLVVCSVVGYVLFMIISRIFRREARLSEHCNITVFAENRNVELNAIVDTGNSIEDAFSDSEIIIADRKQVETLFLSEDCENDKRLQSRYRILPCCTVSGYDMLVGFRCDKAQVVSKERSVVVYKPILAISKTRLTDGYNAIINPKILE